MEVYQITAGKVTSSELIEKIEKWSGQNVYACYQCGKCSAACPLADRMDHLPNQIMKLCQMGDEDTLLQSNTPWVCASCMACSAKCPKGVKITEIMEALRLYRLRQNQRLDKWDILINREDLQDLPPIAIISNFRKLTS
ncbi:MAG: 4Fe-4S dicluster domain-containing protein [Candidatus Hodarchaeales archaeon]